MKETDQGTMKLTKAVLDWPRTEANDPNYYDTLVLKTRLQEMFSPMPVEVGYLDFAHPTVGEAVDELVEAGARDIVAVGGTAFFGRSSHAMIDIPGKIARVQAKRPGVRISYAFPDIDLVKGDLAQALALKIEQALDSQR